MKRVRRQGWAHPALGAALAVFILLILLDVGVTIWSATWGAGLQDAVASQSAMVWVSDLRRLLDDIVKVMAGIVVGAFAFASFPSHD